MFESEMICVMPKAPNEDYFLNILLLWWVD